MSGPAMFEYRHVVGLEETNAVGNVYYVHHVRWQGRCREMFLREHCPGLLERLQQGLLLVTTRVECEYFAELHALDCVAVRMSLVSLVQHRIGMAFEYWCVKRDGEELVARGEQEVACMQKQVEGGVAPVDPPAELLEALAPYRTR